MPAKSLTISAKNKTELRTKVDKALKDAAKKGFIFIKSGFREDKVKKSKGGYEIEIEVHS
jgi:hypothetical protein